MGTAAMVVTVIMIGLSAYMAAKYTVMQVPNSDDWLILSANQAQECKSSGNCQIYSDRELSAVIVYLLSRYKPSKDSI